jgi:hypothetical protein
MVVLREAVVRAESALDRAKSAIRRRAAIA